jgi:hypothetical protein
MSKKIILKGTTEQLKPMITQILAINQMLENLDFSDSSDRSDACPDRRFRPQIRLHFMQDTDFEAGANAPGYHGRRRVPATLTYRIMGETSETITMGELTRIGQQVKEVFGANGGYTWQKGKEMYCYADWDRGYQLQILARGAAQAQDLVTKILSLQNHTPTWKYMSKTESIDQASRYPETPTTKAILGEVKTMPKLRPNVEVRFVHADAKIHRLVQPIVIYDRTGKKVGALVR